jgi:hypothetical protein
VFVYRIHGDSLRPRNDEARQSGAIHHGYAPDGFDDSAVASQALANRHYTKAFEEIIRSATRRAKGIALAHAGVTGELRELLAIELLRPALPPWIEIATRAVIVDHKDGESGEVDIVIYDGSSLPPLSFGGTPKLIPVDVCLYAIEVKTKLTATRVREALAGAEKIARLEYVPELLERGLPRWPVTTALFAFGTDLEGKSDVRRITELRSKDERHMRITWVGDSWCTFPAPALNVVCIVGGEYAWGAIDYHAATERDHQWRLWDTSGDPYDEVIGFITGIANGAPATARERPALDLGYYLIRE